MLLFICVAIFIFLKNKKIMKNNFNIIYAYTPRVILMHDLVCCEILNYVCRHVGKVEKYGLCLYCYTGINIENLQVQVLLI
jgi:hypothetical protein